MPITSLEIVNDLTYYGRNTPNQRYGQAMFNRLMELYPEIADTVRGTMADPFYATSGNDDRVKRFWDTILPYFG